MAHTNHHHLSTSFHHLTHPFNGKTFHVARSPTEAHALKKAISKGTQENIEVCLHGSDEHIEVLQHLEKHHEDRLAALRDRHGDVFHEVENVLLASNNLARELEHARDQGLNLEMNFNKYGYATNVRAHNASGVQSSASSTSGDGKHSFADWVAQRSKGRSMSLFVKPVLRQYFHNGLLWRAQEPEETASYELFLDLVYVGIIAISGDSAAETATGSSLLRFVITFIMGYKVWFDLCNFIGWFDADDIMRRLYVLFILTCLLGFTTNMTEYFNDTYTPLVAFYLAARFALITYQLVLAYLLPQVRWFLIHASFVILLPSIFWIISIHVKQPARNAPIWIAIVLDMFGEVPLFGLLMYIKKCSKPGSWLKRKFEYYPAQNIEHRTERIGSFVILVVGYSVVSLLYQNRSHIGLNSFFGKAVLGLTQAFAFASIYFEMDSFNIHVHAIRRSGLTTFLWYTSHVPLILSFTIAGAALSRLVLTQDTPHSSIDDLAAMSADRAEVEILSGQRWFYCAGIGIALFCSCIISTSNIYRTPPKANAFTKQHRLVVRALISMAIIFLGFADSLNSIKLIGATSGLVNLALFIELAGNTLNGYCCDRKERKCKYAVKRRDMRKSISTMDSEESQDSHEDIGKNETKEEVTIVK